MSVYTEKQHTLKQKNKKTYTHAVHVNIVKFMSHKIKSHIQPFIVDAKTGPQQKNNSRSYIFNSNKVTVDYVASALLWPQDGMQPFSLLSGGSLDGTFPQATTV